MPLSSLKGVKCCFTESASCTKKEDYMSIMFFIGLCSQLIFQAAFHD